MTTARDAFRLGYEAMMGALETNSDVEVRHFGGRPDLYSAYVEGMAAAEEDWQTENEGGDDCRPLPDDFLTEQQSDELTDAPLDVDSYLNTNGERNEA